MPAAGESGKGLAALRQAQGLELVERQSKVPAAQDSKINKPFQPGSSPIGLRHGKGLPTLLAWFLLVVGMPRPKGLLLDLDGVFYIGNRLLPGARETLEWIRGQNVPCRFLTNTSTKNSQELVAKLGNLGLKVDTEEILSAVSATKAYLENQGRPRPRVELLTRESAREEFAEFPPTEKGEADFVVIGDIGAAWSYELMNRVFRLLMNGAQLIAMHRNRFWEDEDGLRMDIGAFVAGLEYVTGQEAVIIGKPSRDFFQLALPQLDCEAADAVMVGDDIQSDIGGAKAQGLQACLVRTGKFRQDLLEDSEVQPDALLDSIADLPGWWEKQGE